MSVIPPVHIEVRSGPGAGKRLVLDRSPITFGRGDDNTIVLDLPTASRRHGELRHEGGRWFLVNASPNGTRLDGKAVTKKPRSLPAEAQVAIGDQTVFSVWTPTETGAVSAGNAAYPPASEAPHTPRLTGRHKVWIGIGAYLLVMLGLFVFFSTFRGSGGSEVVLSVPELSAETIRAEIRRPLPKQPPDARRAREAIEEARELFALADVEKDALYRAHVAYQRALAYTRGDTLDDAADQRRFGVIQKQLTDGVIDRYTRAYNMLRSRQYDLAAEGFQDLTAFYADAGGEVFRNAQAQWDAARRAMGKRK